jgi:DNA-binding response OmpR family regulator
MVILIVEDEYLIGLALVLVLAVAGHHTVGPATSADEALQLAQAERPELAFVDININGDRDGVDVARLLTEHGTTCIFLTAQLDRARAARDVAVGVITKPYDPNALLQTVEVAAHIREGVLPAAVPRHLELFA